MNGVFDHELPDVGSETINVIGETTIVENHTITLDDENTFRKPFDVPPVPVQTHKTNLNNNENASNANTSGKITREIVSCFMTTGGFISPAREGKLPDAKKPIIIEEDPEPEEIVTKQRSPSPEVIERKHHSNKRDNKNDTFESSKSFGNNSTNTSNIDESYEDDENGKEVKLYEVIQTVPEPLLKKKTKKSQSEIAQFKEQKKQKKMQQMKNSKLAAAAAASAPANPFDFSKNDVLGLNTPGNDKLKKKIHKMEAIKKKHKKLGAVSFSVENPEQPDKHKKRISKLTKKNLQAMGLNPNAIEGFAIPTPMDVFPTHDNTKMLFNPMAPKESQKKMKLMQKLSNEPDKQKTKFFKKLSSTSSHLLSKANENPHEIDRMLAENDRMLAEIKHDMNHQMSSVDEYDGINRFSQMIPGIDLNRSYQSLDNLPPSKKQKLLKKSNKIPKEPKIPKIKKVKKDPLIKKERVPKARKLELPVMPNPILHQEENPLSKMFLKDEFRPNVGLIDQFSGSGLNPFNPLFQSVPFDLPVRDPMQNYPFASGLPGNYDFANLSRFKRPNFSDPVPNEIVNLSRDIVEPPKPLCNVAPLMPPSLVEMHQNDEYMELNKNASHSSHFDQKMLNFGTVKKNVSFSTPHFNDQPYDDSPIIINSDDDDDKIRNLSQSPGLSQEPEFGGEIKRKKVKDKKDKEKKEKKDKETGVVKLKKKKDKKDKSKNKGEHSKPPKDKSALKEEKRKKKKERERAGLSIDGNDGMSLTSNPFYATQSHSEWPRDAFSKEPDIRESSDMNPTFNADSSLETSTIPKLTLKLPPNSSSPSSRTSRPSTPDFTINKKL